ncbi:cleft lip and palate transmembrane protein 1 [Puma concolor]|uniref:Cleft lip and palate transmembrane protein 1 n=1 Tax=Puma concolor TaxID=9696 RepID=A0A6P6H2V0_PUMCO|nr:cleft lip and palate transmembrane protein 1 [Puma concolor]
MAAAQEADGAGSAVVAAGGGGSGQVASNGSIGRDPRAETQPRNPAPQPAPNAWQVIKGVLFSVFGEQVAAGDAWGSSGARLVLRGRPSAEPAADDPDDEDPEEVALLETNPYLLALTIIVSIVHSVFEFLAFKNDIQFWNSRQSLEGLSVRSVFFGVFQSFVVLLYILDNETNFVVQVSVFIGVLIDLWKITKVMDVRLDREHKVAGLFPRPTFKDKSTYIESSTKVYDDMAFRYLSWILFPLLGCYAVYSLLYLEHKGWYSWVLSMLYGFLLTFGFITMTPQLFINYKLKSVAHLPWRMLTYKALNTFIDDLFAFVIKMPVMYRIGCLRDDVVFFIYLYQRWIYRVDPTRVNEFGMSGEAPTAAAPVAEAPTAAGALPPPPASPTLQFQYLFLQEVLPDYLIRDPQLPDLSPQPCPL